MTDPANDGAVLTPTAHPHAALAEAKPSGKKHLIGLGIVAALFIAAIITIHGEVRHLSIASISKEMHSVPLLTYALALSGVLVSYIAVTGYDTLALLYTRHRLPYRKTAVASFASYAISNSLGVPFLTGSAVRYRMYTSWGLTVPDIGILALITGLSLHMGALTIAGIGLVAEAPLFEKVFSVSPLIAYLAGVVCLTLVVIFLWRHKGNGGTWRFRSVEMESPGPRVGFSQLAVSILDWASAGFVLFVLLPPDTPLSYLGFLPIFVAACMLGGLSGLPGGLGVFEAVILLMVPTTSDDALAASLIAYRVLYYLLPLSVAALMLSIGQYRSVDKQMRFAAARAQDFTEVLAPTVFAVIAFLSGAFMLISAMTPNLSGPMKEIAAFTPLPVIELSHFLASIVGLLLLIVSFGLSRKLEHAWSAGIVLLVAGMVLTYFKGAGIEETLIFLIPTGLLATAKGAFYRKSPLSTVRFNLPWIAAILGAVGAAVWLGFFSYEHVAYKDELWWSFTLDGQTSRFLRAIAGISVITLLFLVWSWLSPSVEPEDTIEAPDVAKIRAIIANATTGHADAGLALLGDKRFHFSPSGQSFIMYGIRGRHWIAMSEPVGQSVEIPALLWSFREKADLYGALPVFYSVRKEFLPAALDLGLTAQKVGEAGIVPLAEFGLEGSARSGLRSTHKRGVRDGMSFEVISQADTVQHLDHLHTLSEDWLKKHGGAEKSFTLGRFDPAYLCHFPTAVVKVEGEIVAFANVFATENKKELSIDLMRYGDAAPRGVMDFLFIELMLWGKENCYGHFDLGMAPLSGLEDHRLAPLISKLGAFVYEHANKIYGFEGLRNYKNKFDPVWEPLYLVAPAGLTLPIALGDVAILTSGGIIGMFRKD